MWNCQKKQATFQLKTVQVDNTGSYSCVVAEQPLDATELDKCEGDSMFLQVFGENFTIAAIPIFCARDTSQSCDSKC